MVPVGDSVPAQRFARIAFLQSSGWQTTSLPTGPPSSIDRLMWLAQEVKLHAQPMLQSPYFLQALPDIILLLSCKHWSLSSVVRCPIASKERVRKAKPRTYTSQQIRRGSSRRAPSLAAGWLQGHASVAVEEGFHGSEGRTDVGRTSSIRRNERPETSQAPHLLPAVTKCRAHPPPVQQHVKVCGCLHP